MNSLAGRRQSTGDGPSDGGRGRPATLRLLMDTLTLRRRRRMPVARREGSLRRVAKHRDQLAPPSPAGLFLGRPRRSSVRPVCKIVQRRPMNCFSDYRPFPRVPTRGLGGSHHIGRPRTGKPRYLPNRRGFLCLPGIMPGPLFSSVHPPGADPSAYFRTCPCVEWRAPWLRQAFSPYLRLGLAPLGKNAPAP